MLQEALLVSMSKVQDQYRDGVAGFVGVAGGLSSAGWDRIACGKWTAVEVARHVLAVARWYDLWLDRALAGETARPFDSAEMAERNDAELAKLAHLSGPDAVSQFEQAALNYLERTTDHWNMTYPYPYGVVTTGLHCGLAASEWHIHAWDVATSADGTYEPKDPAGLFRAASAAESARRGGTQGLVVKMLAPVGARLRPWEEMLKWSGRG